MAFRGMDVDVIRSVSVGLQGRSDDVTTVVARTDALVGQLLAVWRGGDAEQFEAWWNQQHRPALLSAAESLQGLGRSAAINADEQQTASGGSPGPAAGGATATRAAGRGADVLDRALGGEATGFGLLGAPGTVHGMLDAFDRTRWAGGHSYAGGFNESAHGLPDSSLMKSIGHVGTVFGVASSGYDAFGAFRDGEVGAGLHDSADAVGSAFQGGPTPVSYLVGTNIKVWSDVVDAAHQIDYHQGLPNPFSSNNFTEIWVPGAWDGLKDGVGQIAGDL